MTAQQPQRQLEDWLDDLCVRFIINLPEEDLSSVARICFQVEEAQWFYEDFIQPLDASLPSMTLRTFCMRIFQHCPLLASFPVETHTKAYEEFQEYKNWVPVRGAIMLNEAMDSVVLVKGWKRGASWSFPRGKINKDEDDLDCAIREVYEETGLDLRASHLVPTDKKPKYIEMVMRGQELRLYIFRNVPMDTPFQPRTRKEISKIQWYKLAELPTSRKKHEKNAPNQQDASSTSQMNKFYMVAQFLAPLKKWIASQKKMEERRATSGLQATQAATQASLLHNTSSQCISSQEAPVTEHDTYGTVCRESFGNTAAIDTLDGATKDLQRLLNGPPSTKGPLSFSHLTTGPDDDKGSALLSILKANDAPTPGSMSQVPQIPLDQIATEPPPLPRNPHHRNSQQPVPQGSDAQRPSGAFSLNHVASSFILAQRHASDSQDPDRRLKPSQQIHVAQEASSEKLGCARSPVQDGRPEALKASYDQNQLIRSLPVQSQGQMPHVTVTSRHLPRQLNCHSMALLDAFKRGSTSREMASHTGRVDQSQHPATVSAPDAGHSALHTVTSNTQNVKLIHGVPKDRPLQQAGPASQVSAAQLQSKLLDLFKSSSSRSGSQQYDEKQPHQRVVQTKAMRQSLACSNPAEGAVAAHESTSPLSTAEISKSSSQVLRILQRGESLDALSAMSLPTSHGHKNTAQAPPQSNSIISHAPAGQDHGRTDSSVEQKRKLLSLFGKAQSWRSAGLGLEDSVHSSPRVASMSSTGTGQVCGAGTSALPWRGTASPMSPADQTFLLEYLQNITNNAASREAFDD